MLDIHDVFHMSQLKKCLRELEEKVPMETMDLQIDLQYQERPVKILDTVTPHLTNQKDNSEVLSSTME